ncbi:MAG: hypothetical protein ABIJ23_03325 [Candidatus Magasanikbacteria bacterium]
MEVHTIAEVVEIMYDLTEILRSHISGMTKISLTSHMTVEKAFREINERHNLTLQLSDLPVWAPVKDVLRHAQKQIPTKKEDEKNPPRRKGSGFRAKKTSR